MKTIIKNTVILFVITLVAGLGLGFVYNVTSKARAEQEEKTKLSAYQSVMPGMKEFENVKPDSACTEFIQNKIKEDESANNISPIKSFNATVDEVVLAKDKDGNYINEPEDHDNHGIDAARYWVLGELLGKIIKSQKVSKEELGIW